MVVRKENKQLQIFRYENTGDNLTTLEINKEIWFVSSEVCKLLDIKNSRKAISNLEEDEKKIIDINTVTTSYGIRGNPNKSIVSESGLYELIFQSRKPEAKRFRKWITKEVLPSIRKTGGYNKERSTLPDFVLRYHANSDRVDKDRFSVIGEMYVRLYSKFERAGYKIPDSSFNGKEIRPDVSVGRMFADYLKNNYPELQNDYSYYNHTFANGTVVEARQYKNNLLHIFIEFIEDVWIPQKARDYFKERDPKALEYLPELLECGIKEEH